MGGGRVSGSGAGARAAVLLAALAGAWAPPSGALAQGSPAPAPSASSASSVSPSPPATSGAPSGAWAAAFRRALETDRDPARAFGVVRDAADAGDRGARLVLATLFRNGLGTPRDPARARALLADPAFAGDARADNLMGELTWNGEGGPADRELGAQLFARAAARGFAPAKLNLARAHQAQGWSGHDERKAYEFALEAAEAGLASACNYLGTLIVKGVGVERNAAVASTWFRRGYEAGDLSARANLGLLLARGSGVARDVATGERLMTESANAGNAAGVTNLVAAYEVGVDLPRDYGRAYYWASIGATRGFSDGAWLVQRRDELERKLPAESVASVQKAVREWRPVPAPPAAARAPDPAARAGAAPAERPSSTGTAFFVGAQGYLVTNHHVVADCRRIVSREHGELERVASDPVADIALLRAQHAPARWASLRADPARLGEPIYVFGFPLAGMPLSTGGNFTSGLVSAQVGIRNDANRLQISAPVQPGNSGGAVFDQAGRVVGVVQSKLDALKLASRTGDVAQNVNFAVHARLAGAMLERAGAAGTVADVGERLESEQIAELARSVSIQVGCVK